jgi:hypothetical protein
MHLSLAVAGGGGGGHMLFCFIVSIWVKHGVKKK